MCFLASLLTLTSIFSGIQAGTAKGQSRMALQFHAFEQCKGKETPFKVLNSTISSSRRGAAFISADFYNNKVMKTFSKVELSLTKCADAVSFNTCEYDGTHKFTVGLCQLIAAQNMPWATIMAALHPPARCSLQIGPYKLRNATIDMNDLKAVGAAVPDNLSGRIFIVEVRCFNEKSEMHVCLTVTFSVLRIRN